MLVELVHVTTRDHIRLDGAYRTGSAQGSLRGAAICFLHGTGGNFYGSTLFDQLAERLLAQGAAVLRVNTRGHDLMSTAVTPQGGRRLGAAYEVVDDCRHDVAAWIAWLVGRGHERIVLVGHSLGAVKVLYALGQEPNPAVLGAVALSPPRLSYAAFCSGPQRDEFLRTYEEAERLVQEQKADTLLAVKLPLPFVVTAAGYVEKYGPDERYNFLNFIRYVRCPMLVTFGSLEVASNGAFRGVPESLLHLQRNNVQVAVITGGDHFYSAVRAEIVERVAIWATTLPAEPTL